jgi:DNA-binding transcriptional ArsR family regulator
VDSQLRLWKALGDETRLRILKLLEAGELCVCHIMAVLEMGQSRVSRHMGILKQAGLVSDRRVGKWVFYRLSNEHPEGDVSFILGYLRERLNAHPRVQQDRARLAQLAGEIALIAGRASCLSVCAPQ